MYILQWNARSLIANGQELKRFVSTLENKPEVICIQETWLKSCLDFVICGYESVRCDRERAAGGGCATFVREGCLFMKVEVRVELECVVVRLREQNGWIYIVNYYNPCKAIIVSELEEVMGQVGSPCIWVGDFNAHNPLWGSRIKDRNGCNVEEFLHMTNVENSEILHIRRKSQTYL